MGNYMIEMGMGYPIACHNDGITSGGDIGGSGDIKGERKSKKRMVNGLCETHYCMTAQLYNLNGYRYRFRRSE